MNSNQARQKFLNEHAVYILDTYKDMANGKIDPNIDTIVLDKLWTLLEKVIAGAKDLESIKVQTTADVWSLIKDGQITIEDALKLLEALKVEQDIEELPKLREAIENLNKQS